MTTSHVRADLPILSWGTPVVVVSTVNVDGSINLAPISSALWLGDRVTLGFGLASHSPANLERTGEATLCLPDAAGADLVDRLALTTGADPVPPWKSRNGYRRVRDKLGHAGATPIRLERVEAPGVAELPVAMGPALNT